MSGVTEWVINGNEGTTEEGLFLVFFYVCLVFLTGEKIVLIKYSGNCIIGKGNYKGVIASCEPHVYQHHTSRCRTGYNVNK